MMSLSRLEMWDKVSRMASLETKLINSNHHQIMDSPYMDSPYMDSSQCF
jgi:hypothetical protein